MGIQPCHHEDPFVQAVRRYGANVLSGPQTGVEPLAILLKAKRHNKAELRGMLSDIILDDSPIHWPSPKPQLAADLSGSRAVDVDAELALNLAGKFLKGLGVPLPDAKLDISIWKGASAFAFEIKDVIIHRILATELSESLAGRRIKRDASTEGFFSHWAEMFVILRTLTSSEFTLTATSKHGQSIKVDISAIKDVLGESSGTVEWEVLAENSVAFKGPQPLVFAFAALPIGIHESGEIFLGSETSVSFFETPPSRDLESEVGPLYSENGLVQLD